MDYSQATSHLLPRPLTTFVGREAELAAVVALLNRPNVRLLTVTGPGGVGKTRLAIEAARRLEDEYTDGMIFVSLASINDPDLVTSTIAHEIGIRESGPLPVSEQLHTVLADTGFASQQDQASLAIDSCSHDLTQLGQFALPADQHRRRTKRQR